MSNSEQPPEIPGFTYVDFVGSGGYADVFRYEQEHPRMNVAVKVLRARGLTDAIRTQFTTEANAMAKLADHPHIVPVFQAAVSSDGRPYLVMRYYPRGLRLGIEPLTVAQVLRTGIQITSAVETAHRAGILHRDIKPANILLSSYGSPGLTDFGIAGLATEDEDGDDDDNVGVSVPWSPPEVLDASSNGSVRADVYSLAATMWDLLVGRSPFEVRDGDNSSHALVIRIGSVSPPTTRRPEVPASLERLLHQALAKDPGSRPASALEFARALQGIEQEQRLTRTDIVVLDDLSAPVSRAPDPTPAELTRARAPRLVVAPPEVLTVEPSRTADLAGVPSPPPDAVTPEVIVEQMPAPITTTTAPVIAPRPQAPLRGVSRVQVIALSTTLLVLAALVAVLFTSGSASPDGIPESAGRTGSAATLPDLAPGVPVVTGDRLDPGTVRFAWTYSHPLASDSFFWIGADGVMHSVPDTTVDVAATASACIQVRVRRPGASTLPSYSPPVCAG